MRGGKYNTILLQLRLLEWISRSLKTRIILLHQISLLWDGGGFWHVKYLSEITTWNQETGPILHMSSDSANQFSWFYMSCSALTLRRWTSGVHWSTTETARAGVQSSGSAAKVKGSRDNMRRKTCEKKSLQLEHAGHATCVHFPIDEQKIRICSSCRPRTVRDSGLSCCKNPGRVWCTIQVYLFFQEVVSKIALHGGAHCLQILIDWLANSTNSQATMSFPFMSSALANWRMW